MPRQSYFSPQVFTFLKEVAANNNKEWWDANKDRYITLIREPAKEFIEDFGPRLQAISEHFVADTRTNGGSLMRPYRDTRFSKDKTPYKTNVGIQFRHEMGKDVHAPGFYVHIAPSDCWAGVGMWHPEPKVARVIRDNIHERPDEWKKATKSKAFTDAWTMEPAEDEVLKRVPKEYGEDNPYPDDLRLKSFTAGHGMTQKAVTSPDFDETLAAAYKKASAFTGFLCTSMGLRY
ncbi:MAG: TIGR02453 family protein [Acidimicrobiia bacterium]|nr:TIGR02453 family protein [Acidimicrobiia bacterium]